MFATRIIKDIAVGSRHTLLLTNTNEIYGFGVNDDGQLGLNNSQSQNTPVLLDGIWKDHNIRRISAGSRCSFLLLENRQIFAFGLVGRVSLQNTSLISMLSGLNILEIASGTHHALFLTQTGQVYGLGDNSVCILPNLMYSEGNLGLEAPQEAPVTSHLSRCWQ